MGSISLMCPMCCGETFENSESLKVHLLNMTENLFCPGCSTKTYSVAALIQHLDCCGKEFEQDEHNKEECNDFETTSNNGDGPDILMVSDFKIAKIGESINK